MAKVNIEEITVQQTGQRNLHLQITEFEIPDAGERKIYKLTIKDTRCPHCDSDLPKNDPVKVFMQFQAPFESGIARQLKIATGSNGTFEFDLDMTDRGKGSQIVMFTISRPESDISLNNSIKFSYQVQISVNA